MVKFTEFLKTQEMTNTIWMVFRKNKNLKRVNIRYTNLLLFWQYVCTTFLKLDAFPLSDVRTERFDSVRSVRKTKEPTQLHLLEKEMTLFSWAH